MEPVIVGSLPGFEEYANRREGFEMVFAGNAPTQTEEDDGERIAVTLTVPPLSFHSLRQLQTKQKLRGPDPTPEQIRDDIIDTVCLALKRNYRGVPRWLVEQSLDGQTMTNLTVAMRDMAGGEKKVTETKSP